MRRMVSGLAAAALVGLSASAAASAESRLLYFGADEAGAGFAAIDTTTGGETPTMNVMFVPREFRVGDHTALYFAMMKVRVDCRGRTTQLLSVRGYSDVGDLVREEGVSPAEAVDPGKEPSVNMFRVACGLPSAPHEWVFATGTAAIKWWRLQ